MQAKVKKSQYQKVKAPSQKTVLEASSKRSAKKTKSGEKSFDWLLFFAVVSLIVGLGIFAAFFFTLYAATNENSFVKTIAVVFSYGLEFFGHLSILPFALGICFISTALFYVRKSENTLIFSRLLRLGIGSVLLSFCVSLGFAISSYGGEFSGNLAKRGGYLGYAIVREFAIAFDSQVFIKYLLFVTDVVLVLAICFVCFGLKTAAIQKVLTTVWKIFSAPFVGISFLLKKRHEHFERTFVSDKDLALKKAQEGNVFLGNGNATPKSKKNVSIQDPVFDTTEFNLDGKAKPFRVGGAFATQIENTIFTQEPLTDDEPSAEVLAEDRLANLERILKEGKDGRRNLDDIEERKLRDEILDIRRARRMNQWEEENDERPVVQGFVRNEQKEKTLSNEREVVGELSGSENTVSNAASAEENGTAFENTASLKGEQAFTSIVRQTEEKNETTTVIPEQIHIEYDPYVLPQAEDVFEETPEQLPDYSGEELQEIAHQLEQHLESYKIKGIVKNIVTGPVITRFELEPGPGIKVSKFLSLQDDLALALSAVSIRILAPIPGKSFVGIEIPNRKAHIIYCRDLFLNKSFEPSSEKLQIVLGKDITGVPFAMDLARAPHLLIAGQTGSGKSVCINVLMASLLLSKTPDELRLLLVDPKVVELKMYENIPHLLAPVITQPEIAVQALKWLCIEMDRRYEVLAKIRVRNIAGFNEKIAAGEFPEDFPEEERKKMPFIVLIIDELADLMMVAGKEVEKSIARIAQKARAVGIHLVLATQRPSSNVITGLIKANLPTRIAFKVGSALDSRIIMDTQGADRLLGKGDMLYRPGDKPDPYRVHGAFLTDSEAEKLAQVCSNQNVNYPQLESFETEPANQKENGCGLPSSRKKRDVLLLEVALFAVNAHGVSASGIQRAFSVGFARAASIVDQMEELGICGPSKGNSKPRDILMSEEEIRNLMERF